MKARAMLLAFDSVEAVIVKPATPKEVKALRADLKGRKKREFLALCMEEICSRAEDRKDRICQIRAVQDWEIHHILPVSLGGGNDETNLSLVRPGLHKYIHGFMDAQRGQVMEYGVLRVPKLNRMVWGLDG